MLLSGIFPPITTPFYPDGEVYYKKIESNVERYSRTPVAGIVVQGSTGEAILLSDQERRDVLKTALAAAAPNKVMIAGTGIESATETLRLTEYAAELGYDAAMVRTPHYYKKQMLPANLLAFYRTVADRSALPIIIYNFPQATGYDIPAEVVIELAGHPQHHRHQGIERQPRQSESHGRGHAPCEKTGHSDRNLRGGNAAHDQGRSGRER